jgi:DNA polymerase III delta prime subunit
MTDWFAKYKPDTIKDIVGNKRQITEILKWIDDFKHRRTNKQVLILNGPSGIGKSLIAQLVLQESNYRINNLNLNNITELNKLYEKLEIIITSKNIFTMLYKQDPISIIIDDIENIHINTHKNFIVEFIDILKSFKTHIPIICTSKLYSLKKLNNLESVCHIIQLKYPSVCDLTRYIKKLTTLESLLIDFECIPLIISHCDNDVRKLIIILEDIYKVYNKETITVAILNNLFNSIQKKDLDEPLFDLTDRILNTQLTENEANVCFNLDRYMLPYMVHENYIPVIMRKDVIIDTKLSTIIKCSESLSNGDIIQSYSMKNCNWVIDEYNCTLSCKFLNYHILKLKRGVYTNKYNYTTLFNKVSLHSINYKYYIQIKNILNISENEVYYLGLLINYYLYITVDYQVVVDIIKYYKLSLDNIPLILKIYKLGSLNTVEIKKITVSLKKKLMKLM